MNLDIFNRKKIRDLEEKLIDTEIERNNYRNMAISLEQKLDDIARLEETTPEDCKKGPWCVACEFGKVYHYMEHYDFNTNTRICNKIYVCGKGESCKNFIQRENNE